MTQVSFYYDVVCPYSYLETHAVERAEDAGLDRGHVAAVRIAPGAAPAPGAAWRPSANRLDRPRVCPGARRGRRDPPASLPAALDASARGLHLGDGARAVACVQARALRGVLLRGRRRLERDADRTRGPGAGLDPDDAVAAAYSEERIARSPRSARPQRKRASPVFRRSSPTGASTGAWAASSDCFAVMP